jgi:hypothetical protein
MVSQTWLKENKTKMTACRVLIMGEVDFKQITSHLAILVVTLTYSAEFPPLMNRTAPVGSLITKIKRIYIIFKTIITCFNSKFSMRLNLMRSRSNSKETCL